MINVVTASTGVQPSRHVSTHTRRKLVLKPEEVILMLTGIFQGLMRSLSGGIVQCRKDRRGLFSG